MRDLAKTTVLLLSVSWIAGTAGAQIDPDTSIKFNLSTPGARSLAMGGAFLALADDATAAYTNPAGLTNLTLGGSEATVELRQTQFANSFVDNGHFSSDAKISPFISNLGQDTVDGLQRDEETSETNGISFLSFGYVLPRGLTLALYRHELANFAAAFETQGPFNDDECDTPNLPNGLCQFRFFPRRSRTDLKIVNYGVSAAWAFEIPPLKGLKSTLSVGLGVSYYTFEGNGSNEFFALDRYFDPGRDDLVDRRLPGNFYGPPEFRTDNLRSVSEGRGDDDAFGINLGFLWKLGRQQRWSVGGVFRQGPEFETELTGETCELEDGEPGALTATRCTELDLGVGSLTVPDVFGLGLAYRTAEGKTKISLDVNRVRYSQRLADYEPAGGLKREDFRIEDADQVHLGFERIVLVVESLFVGTVRFGTWNEPFHELEYFGDDGDTRAFLASRSTDDEIHFSLGIGLVIKEDYQLDAAVDFSDPTNTFSFSLVKFF